jgi:cell shape-determining protein MreD
MKWTAIFQMPVVALLVALATMITQAAGICCEYSTGSNPFWFAHFWVSDPLPADIISG